MTNSTGTFWQKETSPAMLHACHNTSKNETKKNEQNEQKARRKMLLQNKTRIRTEELSTKKYSSRNQTEKPVFKISH